MTELAHLNFNEIEVGLTKKFTVTITESMINDFAEISGDFSPLHMDDAYAGKTTYKKRICHGMLLASFFSQLVGMYIPGKNALYFSQTLNFENPCFVNDEIIIEGKVEVKSEATKMITIRTSIYGKSNQNIVTGIAKVIVRE